VRFSDLTRTELNALAERSAIVLVPIGAIEQHGAHLPADTDTFLAEHFALECARSLDYVIVAPAIPWGLSGNHVPLGATISLRPQTHLELLTDVAKGLLDSGFPNQVWINGHNGNRPTLALLVYECQVRWGVSIAAVSYYDFGMERYREIRRSPVGGELHAGELETSLMLALAPARVRGPVSGGALVEPLTSFDARDAASGGPAHIGYDYSRRFPDGVAGDPDAADEATGREVAQADLAGLLAFVEDYRERVAR
jgi:creatinine amidohydrolase